MRPALTNVASLKLNRSRACHVDLQSLLVSSTRSVYCMPQVTAIEKQPARAHICIASIANADANLVCFDAWYSRSTLCYSMFYSALIALKASLLGKIHSHFSKAERL